MIWKLGLAVVLAVIAAVIPALSSYWPWVLVLGVVVAFIIEGVRIVPQQSAWVVERLGRFHGTLEPGLNLIIPFLDRVAYTHSLKEVPLDVPEQICITKDNTQLGVDGILYYQVTDPRLASYGSSNYIAAISQLAQTTLRSEIGKMELDKTFESRDEINRQIVASLDEAGRNWGIKVLRYEIKSLTPPEAILRSMQQQITAEREKRALIAKSEGERQQEINVADGEKQAAVLVITMVIYMLKAAKHLRRDIAARLEAAAVRTGRGAWLGVFLFVVLMVTREGMETAFITASLFRQTDTAHFALGAFGGLGLAAALAWAWVRYGQLVNLALFFKVTSVFLVLFAFQLVIYSFHEATEANLLPLDNAYWHVATEPYGPEGQYGALLTYLLVLVPAAWLVFAALKTRLARVSPG